MLINEIASGGIAINGSTTLNHPPFFPRNDVSFVLSGGSSNLNPKKSLGGASSAYFISNLRNNLLDTAEFDKNSQNNIIDYRAFYIFNDNQYNTLYNVKVWIEITDTICDISIGVGEIGDVSPHIGYESIAPTGIDFSQPLSEDDGLLIGDLESLSGFFGWVKRIVPAGTISQANTDGFVFHMTGNDDGA